MWSTVACLLVVLAAFDTTNAFDRSKAKEKVTEFRIRSQNLHIDDIEKQLEKLEHEFDALSAPVSKEDTVHLKTRVRKLEGKQCPRKEVSCGGDWPECVHNLLVCDGIKDCHNGRDEDEAICDGSIVRVGSTFRGLVHWSGYVLSGDHEYSVTITLARRSPFFNARTYVRAMITRELEDNTVLTIPAKGYYAFGARSLVLAPEDNASSDFPFITICSFFSGDNDHADCKIKTLTTMEKAGLAKITRVQNNSRLLIAVQVTQGDQLATHSGHVPVQNSSRTVCGPPTTITLNSSVCWKLIRCQPISNAIEAIHTADWI